MIKGVKKNFSQCLICLCGSMFGADEGSCEEEFPFKLMKKMLIIRASNPIVGRFQVKKDMFIGLFKLFDFLHEDSFHLIFIFFLLLDGQP